MSDFDFDELDRAVTGALGNDSPSEGAELQDTLETVSPEQTQSSQSPVEPVQKPVAADPEVSQTARSTQPVTPAARRSSGRFMDVVHPSSDMRANTQVNMPSKPVIKPLVTPNRPTQEVAQATPPPQALRQSVPEQQSGAQPNADDVLPIFEAEDWRTPLESPFLADAKVEKRPLGGEAPTSFEFDPSELLEAPDDPRLEATTMPDPIDFAAQSQTSSVDALNTSPQTLSDTPQEVEVEPVVANDESEDSFDSHLAAIHESTLESTPVNATEGPSGYGEGSFQPQVTQAPDVPSGPTSISQQYQEQPSSSPESGAIYDTEAYHKPLAPVVKKKSGSLTILWIALIVLLGGGAGAAFYFYVLPML